MVYAEPRPGTGKWRCHYCKARAGQTTDHIIPSALGGPSVMWNYVPACVECNNAKGSDWPTCGCDKCAVAVTNFLADPRTRAIAERVLTRRLGHFETGIASKRAEIETLEMKRANAMELLARISQGSNIGSIF